MTLTLQDLGALGEFLGSIAVLVTLIYLALQMRQNTMAIGAQLDAARINAVLSKAGVAQGVLTFFSRYPSFGSHWEQAKVGLVPDFVAWVEEQREKATQAG